MRRTRLASSYRFVLSTIEPGADIREVLWMAIELMNVRLVERWKP